MLHKNHALDHKKINRLCNKYPTRIKQKETEIGTELFAHFQKEESEAPFGFLFWLFQELRMCMKNPIH
jgi:hypothetical protein